MKLNSCLLDFSSDFLFDFSIRLGGGGWFPGNSLLSLYHYRMVPESFFFFHVKPFYTFTFIHLTKTFASEADKQLFTSLS